ncbi:MAG: hypothetical protein ACYS8X_11995 [Planctomycetota bacterium]|jgi:lipopolysaccharide export LptBFGC system permease protein LptF
MPPTFVWTSQLLEAVMLICFGASWPISVVKTWRSKQTGGKSLLFMVLIFIGYLAGISAKAVAAAQAGRTIALVTALYVFNAVFVLIDIVLYCRFRHPTADFADPTMP